MLKSTIGITTIQSRKNKEFFKTPKAFITTTFYFLKQIQLMLLSNSCELPVTSRTLLMVQYSDAQKFEFIPFQIMQEISIAVTPTLLFI